MDDMIISAPPILEFDPYAEDVILDPAPFLESVRNAGVAYLPANEAYAVGGMDEAVQLSKDFDSFTSSHGIGLLDITKPGLLRPTNALQECDPPQHSQLRKVVQKILSPSRVRGFQELLAERARILVDDLLEKGSVDGTRDIAQAFILDVFSSVAGIDLPAEPAIATSNMMLNLMGPVNAVSQRAMAAAEPHLPWFNEAITRRNAAPGGLVDLAYQAEEEGLLPEGIGGNMAIVFVGGGFDSTIAGIANALRLLALHPAEWARLRSDPTLVPAAINEAIRFDPPFRVYYRMTTRPVKLGAFDLAPQTKIGVWMGAVNRDPRHFDRPDEFDVSRRGAHAGLGFGTGPHNCVGQILAKAETEAIISALVRKVARLELTGTPQYEAHNQVRMPGKLPLRLHPG
ncbi:cytochrome P450 [Sphingobium sp. TA15]|uniref:Putative cytochrome P450 n=1 Tax=Sphingobium indicum (strain DSM 16413 / CCM 7287 / MTCC 6362 / UT26 / NBRC 101211 / UT26S) TaxID=452662 RepID=D4Z8G0_SPHIU|nr:cytochrome P450 [Sphingobium indicum]BAI98779.1 putative cytochrome P450 [Sphingobium indicum UT26S]BDD68826.1 cytochrome P450 [Sphingobium sp. TA15]